MTATEPLVLGIESSCDETGIGIVRGSKLLTNTISSSMEEHVRFGGVIPEIASRAHLEAMLPALEKALTEAGVSLSDIFVILPTLSVSPQDSIKTITELQECFSQNTGIPAENLVILSENRFLQESGTFTNLTTHFEEFLQKLLEK